MLPWIDPTLPYIIDLQRFNTTLNRLHRRLLPTPLFRQRQLSPRATQQPFDA